ncbi:MAG: 50S ribosomal protein L9 [Pseudomonadota bacterium]
MDVILLERIESLGQMGQVVKVKPGYARNYLLPRKKALRATKENLAYFERQRTQLEAQNLTNRQEAEGVAARIEGLTVIVLRQAGEGGQLYGSVNTRDIAEAVTKAGFTLDRRQVLLDQPIKMLGLFKPRIALHPEVIVTVGVNVAQSEEEAALQAAGKPSPAAGEAPSEAPAPSPAAEPAAAAPKRKRKAAEAAPKEPKKKPAKAKAKTESEGGADA